jgi:hypothetical protein
MMSGKVSLPRLEDVTFQQLGPFEILYANKIPKNSDATILAGAAAEKSISGNWPSY